MMMMTRRGYPKTDLKSFSEVCPRTTHSRAHTAEQNGFRSTGQINIYLFIYFYLFILAKNFYRLIFFSAIFIVAVRVVISRRSQRRVLPAPVEA